ncbi:MAG: cell envelope integrity protein TolA [Rhodanobacteraceae bacterium]|jgi:colicin import membrane protein|nr:cell envelope integrity protein TolA [Rhodanobacteraceae bacterium]
MESAKSIESLGDKLRAFALALGLHLACILALLVGLWWTHESKPVAMPGPVIEATLVGPTAAPKARSGAAKPAPAQPTPPPPPPPKPEPPKPEPKPAPQPEPPKPAKETPSEVQRQELIEREKVAALAQQKAEQEKREQEEKVRQQQVLLEEEKQKKIKEEAQKQLAEIRKQREAAEKKARLERERLAQLEDRNQRQAAAQAQPEAEHEAEQAQTGAGGQDNDLAARYAAAIQAAVTQNWNRPEDVSAGLRCTLNIVQIPGGDVISATVGSPCNADPATRNSIEQAVMKAAPLPYQGYEKVFQRSIKFNFKYDG